MIEQIVAFFLVGIRCSSSFLGIYGARCLHSHRVPLIKTWHRLNVPSCWSVLKSFCNGFQQFRHGLFRFFLIKPEVSFSGEITSGSIQSTHVIVTTRTKFSMPRSMNYFPSVNLGVPPYIPAIAVTENLQSHEPRDERQAFVKQTFAFKVETVNPFAF